MEHKKNTQRGITLIALVITIIVLLILAGVSLSLVVGQNGVLNKAQESVTETKKAKLEEEVQFVLSEWETDYLVSQIAYEGRTATTPSGAEVICSGGNLIVVDSSSDKIYTSPLENGVMGELQESTGLTKESQAYKAMHPKVPTGFTHTEGEWNTGFVIQENTTKDEFVWIPVVSESVYARKSGVNNWSMSTETHGKASGSEALKYVRGDQLGVSDILGTPIDDTLQTPVETGVVAPEAKVVNAAGGFYVSRYEIGIASATRETAQSGWTKDTISSKKGCEPARNISQIKSLELANSWKSGEADTSAKTAAYQSGLITGTQWDVMCNFIGWSECNSDCTSWGNYYNALGTIGANVGRMGTETAYDNTQHNLWYVGTSAFTKNKNTRTVVATGSFVTENGGDTSKKNIYDVAGNVWELTTEVPTDSKDTAADGHRVARGGSTDNYGNDNLADYRAGNHSASCTHWYLGFRAVLYVK